MLVSFLGLAGCGNEPAAPTLDTALEAAITIYREDGAERALPEFLRLAKEYAANGKRRDEAAAIHYIGESHWRLGNFDQARESLDRALTHRNRAAIPAWDGQDAQFPRPPGMGRWQLRRSQGALSPRGNDRPAGRRPEARRRQPE